MTEVRLNTTKPNQPMNHLQTTVDVFNHLKYPETALKEFIYIVINKNNFMLLNLRNQENTVNILDIAAPTAAIR